MAIEAGKLHIEHAPFDLHSTIDDVLGLLRVHAAEKGLRLQTDIRLPHPCWVQGDAARVRRAAAHGVAPRLYARAHRRHRRLPRRPGVGDRRAAGVQLWFAVAAAGVQLSALLRESSVQEKCCDTQYWSGLVGVASAIRAVADSLRLGATTRCCLLRRRASGCKTLANPSVL